MNAVERFYAESTLADAVAVAIADMRALKLGTSEFFSALHQAEDQFRATEEKDEQ